MFLKQDQTCKKIKIFAQLTSKATYFWLPSSISATLMLTMWIFCGGALVLSSHHRNRNETSQVPCRLLQSPHCRRRALNYFIFFLSQTLLCHLNPPLGRDYSSCDLFFALLCLEDSSTGSSLKLSRSAVSHKYSFWTDLKELSFNTFSEDQP